MFPEPDVLRHVFAWLFLGGFIFLTWVGIWAVITVTRMRREQTIAIGILHAMAARLGLKEAIDKIQVSPVLWGRRVTDFPKQDEGKG
jgi:hypothetical protein